MPHDGSRCRIRRPRGRRRCSATSTSRARRRRRPGSRTGPACRRRRRSCGGVQVPQHDLVAATVARRTAVDVLLLAGHRVARAARGCAALARYAAATAGLRRRAGAAHQLVAAAVTGGAAVDVLVLAGDRLTLGGVGGPTQEARSQIMYSRIFSCAVIGHGAAFVHVFPVVSFVMHSLGKIVAATRGRVGDVEVAVDGVAALGLRADRRVEREVGDHARRVAGDRSVDPVDRLRGDRVHVVARIRDLHRRRRRASRPRDAASW